MVGIDIDKFWTNTFKDNNLLEEFKYNNDLQTLSLVRDLRFDIYNTAFAGMNGVKVFKKIKKQSDLFPLPQDKKTIKKLVLPISKEHALSKIREAHKRK